MSRYILNGVAVGLALAAFSCGPDTDGTEPPVIPPLSVWVADQPDKEVVIFDNQGELLKVVGEFGVFSKPNAIDVRETTGEAWVCDFYTNRIRKFDASGDPLASTPEMPNNAVLNPTGLSINQNNGDCWVCDRGNDRVIRFNANAVVTATVTGFSYPRNLSVERTSGNVWIADEGGNAVVRVLGTSTGNVNLATAEICRYDGMSKPWAVAAEDNGGAWAISQEEGTIVRLAPTGEKLAEVQGFDTPTDVAIHKNAGLVIVADAGKDVLVALPLSLSGVHQNFTTVATFTISGAGDPVDVFVEPAEGNIYAAEMANDAVVGLDKDGKEISRIEGLSGPAAVAVWKNGGGQ